MVAVLLTYQVGTCSVYVLFTSSNIKKIADQYVTNIDIRYYMTVLLIIFILLSYVQSLKQIAPLSGVANICALGGFLIIMYYIFFTTDLKVEERKAVGSIQDTSLFFGTVLFALANIGVVSRYSNISLCSDGRP